MNLILLRRMNEKEKQFPEKGNMERKRMKKRSNFPEKGNLERKRFFEK